MTISASLVVLVSLLNPQHMNTRMKFVDPSFNLTVITQEEVVEHGRASLPPLSEVDVFYALSIQDESLSEGILCDYAQQAPNTICFNCSNTLGKLTHLGSYHPHGRLNFLWKRLPFNLFDIKRRLEVFTTAQGFWERGHSDDFLVSLSIAFVVGWLAPLPPVSAFDPSSSSFYYYYYYYYSI